MSAASTRTKIASRERVDYDLVGHLHRSFIDLATPSAQSALMAHGPVFAYEARGEGIIGALGLQRILAPAFRVNLASATHVHVAVRDPRESRGVSDRWNLVCDALDSWADLSDIDRIWLLRLLMYLGFHELILGLVPDSSDPARCPDESGAAILHLRAFARFMLHTGHWGDYDPYDERLVLRSANPRSRPYHEAAKALLVFEGKANRDVEAARLRANQMSVYLDTAERDLTAFHANLLHSAHFRAVSYVPFLAGDLDQMTEDMMNAERFARVAVETAKNEREQLVARDNLHPLLESRMREALSRGDLELALTRITEICLEVDPWDSKAHIERAEMLLRMGRSNEATDEYRVSAILGPPGVPISRFGAAKGAQRNGPPSAVALRLIDVVLADPLSESALDEMQASDHPALRIWAEHVCRELGRSNE